VLRGIFGKVREGEGKREREKNIKNRENNVMFNCINILIVKLGKREEWDL